MKGDFSRFTFHPGKHFSGVCMQQGRVQLDADWNEQNEIGRHRDESNAAGIMGQCAAPMEGGGFRVDVAGGQDLAISAGRLYVDGVLCENDAPIAYAQHTAATTGDYPSPVGVIKALKNAGATVGVVYLDVWPRHVTALEDASIREVALGGPDTATRLQTLWQIKTLALPNLSIHQPGQLQTLMTQREQVAAGLIEAETQGNPVEVAKRVMLLNRVDAEIALLLARSGDVFGGLNGPEWASTVAPSSGALAARIAPSGQSSNPCELVPRTGFQRLDNQLYRVEIHSVESAKATFKWSRENGSVVVPWIGQDNLNLKVGSVGRDSQLGFSAGDWVELMDDTHELLGEPGLMLQVFKVDGDVLVVNAPSSGTVDIAAYPRNPRIRRWDQSAASLDVSVPAGNDGFIPLESNLEVKFTPDTFRTGDYWLIPARTAGAATELGSIEWPVNGSGTPIPQAAAGVGHHYAQLAVVWLDSGGKLHVIADRRRVFPALTRLHQLFHVGGGGDGLPSQPLPAPLLAGVSNGGQPAAGALVQFQVFEGGGYLLGDSGAGSAVISVTDLNGIASCRWVLGPNGPQQVEARLVDAALTPQHVPARYFATFSAPTSEVRITEFRVGQIPLYNGSYVTPADLIGGIRILCSAPLDPRSVNSSVNCAVTLYLPYPLPNQGIFNAGGLMGFQPVVLIGSVSVDPSSSRTLRWLPSGAAPAHLQSVFAALAKYYIPQALPMRLEVNGNFVFSTAFTTQLDADTFLGVTGFQLPTGDGRPGGCADFWFVLVPVRPAYGASHQVRLDALLPSPPGIGTDLL